MQEPIRLLLIEDNPHDARFVRAMLSEVAPAPTLVHDGYLQDGLRRLHGGGFDCVLLDLSLPDGGGLQGLRSVMSVAPRVPVVVLTGLADTDVAMAAMRQGAQDYLVKGEFDARLLERALRYAIQRMRTTLALRASEERFALAVRGTAEGIWDWDLVADRVYLSPRWFEMSGLEYRGFLEAPDQWLGRVHTEDRQRLRAQLEAHRLGGGEQEQAEYRLLHKGGYYRWMLCRWLAVRNDKGVATRFVGSQSDITEQRVQDPVTALPNAVLIRDRLDRALSRARFEPGYQFAVAMVGVDRMKLINDGLGRAAGDDLLVRCAHALQQTLRPRDFVGRLSGDEFVVHLEDVGSAEAATRAARRLQERVAAPIRVSGQDLRPSVSVGIVMSDPGTASADDLLRDASAALHRANAIAPGQVQVFDPAMQARAVAQLALEADLRHALERDELCLYFQPVFELESGRAGAVEALLRWQHPERGLLLPDQFISLAEETGLIVPIGEWVLAAACDQLREWRSRDPQLASLQLSINVAPRQFLESDLVALVTAALEDNGIPPAQLQLEVTERVLLDHGQAPLEQMRALRGAGVRVALDDFGTGVSSLGHVRRESLDALKLAPSLIGNLRAGARELEVARAVVSLANNLGLSVVAEGVETEAQREQLVAMRCRFAQGFLFASPAPPEQTLIEMESTGREARPSG